MTVVTILVKLLPWANVVSTKSGINKYEKTTIKIEHFNPIRKFIF